MRHTLKLSVVHHFADDTNLKFGMRSHSHLCYGLVAWGSSIYAKNLFVIQKRAIRAGLRFNDSPSDSFQKFKLFTLEK